MSSLPVSDGNAKADDIADDMDFDLDLDDLDDETLQRLLEEDPALEEELKAIEAAEAEAALLTQSPKEEPAAVLDQSAAEDPLLEAPDHTVSGEGEGEMSVGAVPPPMTADMAADTEGAEDGAETFQEHDDLADYDLQADVVHDEGALSDEMNDLPLAPMGAVEGDMEDISVNHIQPVPRINIHSFCTSEKLTQLVEMATADRRLAKAHVTLQQGGAAEAAEFYAHDATPNLLLIEAGASPDELLSGLEALAQVCDPSTRVVVIGDINDIRLYRELMDRGISEYLVAPQSPLHIIACIGELYADPSAPPIGKSFVFVGARGGTGSSSICHNVAWSLAEEMKSDTILMDLDLAFGTAGLDFEQDPSQGLAEALSAPDRLDDVLLDRLLQKHTDRLSLFSAPNMLDQDYDLPTESFDTVLEKVRGAAPCIAVDLPHVWSAWSKMMLQTADEIILTATPDLSSFRNAKNIIETIKVHRTNDSPPILVLNQVNVPKRPEVPLEQFEEALGLEPQFVLPWDPVLFGNASTNAEPLAEVAPKSKITQEIHRLARVLAGQPNVGKHGGGFNLASLFSKKS